MNKNNKVAPRLVKKKCIPEKNSLFTLIIEGKNFSEIVCQVPDQANIKVIGSVEAIDLKGATYRHKVSVVFHRDDLKSKKLKPILWFGRPSPMCWDLADLTKSYPFKEDFCIDGAGRNHGSDCSVFIKRDDMNKFIIKAERVVKSFLPKK